MKNRLKNEVQHIQQLIQMMYDDAETLDDSIRTIMNKYKRILIQTDQLGNVRSLMVDSANAKRYLKEMAKNAENLCRN